MRKLIGSVLSAGALAAMLVAPVAAEQELCILDPAVHVDGATIQVGVYTRDQSLVAPGAIPQSAPIVVTLLGSRGGSLSTNVADWQAQRPNTVVTVLNTLTGKDRSAKETVEIDAFVPSGVLNDTYFIKVTLPDGTEKRASGRVNTLVRLRVEVPVRHASDNGGNNDNGGGDR
ncbi:MAG: hypothetical protein ACR2JY_19200 [Chloroflexota bacterium]